MSSKEVSSPLSNTPTGGNTPPTAQGFPATQQRLFGFDPTSQLGQALGYVHARIDALTRETAFALGLLDSHGDVSSYRNIFAAADEQILRVFTNAPDTSTPPLE